MLPKALAATRVCHIARDAVVLLVDVTELAIPITCTPDSGSTRV